MNPDENETNLMYIDIEDEGADCDVCQVKFWIQNLNLFTF